MHLIVISFSVLMSKLIIYPLKFVDSINRFFEMEEHVDSNRLADILYLAIIFLLK